MEDRGLRLMSVALDLRRHAIFDPLFFILGLYFHELGPKPSSLLRQSLRSCQTSRFSTYLLGSEVFHGERTSLTQG